MNRIIIIFTFLEIHKNLWKTNDSIQSIQGNRYKLAEVKTLKDVYQRLCFRKEGCSSFCIGLHIDLLVCGN